jgi:hypothetical protein
MLHTIEAAHTPYTSNHEDTNSVSINSSFFLHSGGQNTQDLTPIEQEDETSEHTDSQSDSEGCDGTQSEGNDTHSESEPSFAHIDDGDEAESTQSTPPPDYEDSESESEQNHDNQ